ncbi:LOW QUALITY PROTEIN: hypothetical protein ENH_00076560 [Eimeria necatrix]|uniref:Uncharacterized protein n=1 Tax=Eimeria necatrix TaxID=51315 RepID=U6N140_9EIME|nr:LOW QUALITY PROTEIN: hypothetical protein ENH_00076560 [Eimeria necatrix]CDJ69942.1 hypothetical protein ENH_00076560 [Eimeria necatrix]
MVLQHHHLHHQRPPETECESYKRMSHLSQDFHPGEAGCWYGSVLSVPSSERQCSVSKQGTHTLTHFVVAGTVLLKNKATGSSSKNNQSQQVAWRTEHYTAPGQKVAYEATCAQFQRQSQKNGAQEQEQREQGQAEQQQREHEQVQQLQELEQEHQRSKQAEMLPQQKKQQKQQKQRNSCECKAPGK